MSSGLHSHSEVGRLHPAHFLSVDMRLNSRASRPHLAQKRIFTAMFNPVHRRSMAVGVRGTGQRNEALRLDALSSSR